VPRRRTATEWRDAEVLSHGQCPRFSRMGTGRVSEPRFAPIYLGGYRIKRYEPTLVRQQQWKMNRESHDPPQPRCHPTSRDGHGPCGLAPVALPRKIDVSRLISRGLQRFFKNMRNVLDMNHLQNITQVFDFSPVRKKTGVFQPFTHP
jgi:hypothetical protein